MLGTQSLLSWNDGAVKCAILDFVSRITKQGAADFVPPAERISTFNIAPAHAGGCEPQAYGYDRPGRARFDAYFNCSHCLSTPCTPGRRSRNGEGCWRGEDVDDLKYPLDIFCRGSHGG